MKLQPQSFHIRRQDPRRNSRDMADNHLDESRCPGNAPDEQEEDTALDFIIHGDGIGPVLLQIKDGRYSVGEHSPRPCDHG